MINAGNCRASQASQQRSLWEIGAEWNGLTISFEVAAINQTLGGDFPLLSYSTMYFRLGESHSTPSRPCDV